MIFNFPAWPLSLIILAETGVLLWSHKRMTVWEKAGLALPAVVVAGVYLALDIFNASPTEEVRTLVRLSIFMWMFWKMVFLYLTRQRHT